MTAIERAEKAAEWFDGFRNRSDTKGQNARVAADCIRACIEAAKNENWETIYGDDEVSVWSAFKPGQELFMAALTGEPTTNTHEHEWRLSAILADGRSDEKHVYRCSCGAIKNRQPKI